MAAHRPDLKPHHQHAAALPQRQGSQLHLSRHGCRHPARRHGLPLHHRCPRRPRPRDLPQWSAGRPPALQPPSHRPGNPEPLQFIARAIVARPGHQRWHVRRRAISWRRSWPRHGVPGDRSCCRGRPDRTGFGRTATEFQELSLMSPDSGRCPGWSHWRLIGTRETIPDIRCRCLKETWFSHDYPRVERLSVVIVYVKVKTII